MIDKSKVKKMWVWNAPEGNPKDTKRYVTDICKNGCIAVKEFCEEIFLKNEVYVTEIWNNCEPIKEPTLDDLPEGWEDAWYRVKGETQERRIMAIDKKYNRVRFNIDFSISLFDLKSDWQILVNGEWHDCSEYLGG